MNNLDEQPGPLGGVVDDGARKELRRLWDVIQNRLGYADASADHVLVTQEQLRAVKAGVAKRFDALPIPPKVGAALIGGSLVSTTSASGGAPSGPAGGDLTGTYPNPALAATAVTPGTYGDATHVGKFTVDSKGRLTFAQDVLITGAAPTGAAGGDLTGTYPNPTLVNTAVAPGTYGDSANVAQFTVDAKGRLTFAANVAIAAGGTVTSVATGSGLTGGPITTTGTLNLANVAATASQWFNAVVGNVLQKSQPAFSDISGTIATAQLPALPWTPGMQWNGKPDAGLVLLDVLVPSTWTYTLAAGCTGWAIISRIAHTAQTDYDIQKNLVSIGTMRFAAGGTVPSFIGVSLTTFTGLTDSVQIIAPATPDATGADLRGTLYFLRA